jgi:hypothetical protein
MPTTIEREPPVVSEPRHPELLVHSATTQTGLHAVLAGIVGITAVLVAMLVVALVLTEGL